jgi:hypothetical protein
LVPFFIRRPGWSGGLEQEAEVETPWPGGQFGVGVSAREKPAVPDDERLALPLRRTVEAEEVAVEGDRTLDVPHQQIQTVQVHRPLILTQERLDQGDDDASGPRT